MTAFLEDVASLAVLAPYTVLPGAIVFTRLSLLLFLLPGIGMQVVPVRLRVIVALALTGLLVPLVETPTVTTVSGIVALLAGEAAAGFLLGFLVRIFIHALSITGAILAQSLSLSQIFGATIVEEANTTISNLLTIAGTALFLTLDLHVATLTLFVESYEGLPAGAVFAEGFTALAADEAIRAAASAFSLAVSLALPFLLLNFSYNVILGLMNRAMPQLMVTFVGMPAITFAGLSLLTVTAGFMLLKWRDAILVFLAGGPA